MFSLYLARARDSAAAVPPPKNPLEIPAYRSRRETLAQNYQERLDRWISKQLDDPDAPAPVGDLPQLAAQFQRAQLNFRPTPAGLPQISPSLYQTERERLDYYLSHRHPIRSDIHGPYENPPLQPEFRHRAAQLDVGPKFHYKPRTEKERIREERKSQPQRLYEPYQENISARGPAWRENQPKKWKGEKSFQFSQQKIGQDKNNEKIIEERKEPTTRLPALSPSTSRSSRQSLWRSASSARALSRNSSMSLNSPEDSSEVPRKTYWKALAGLAHGPAEAPTSVFPTLSPKSLNSLAQPVPSLPLHSISQASLSSSISGTGDRARFLYSRAFQSARRTGKVE